MRRLAIAASVLAFMSTAAWAKTIGVSLAKFDDNYQTVMRNRLIESRLTPNAISLTGFVLCVVSAVLILQGWWIAGGIAFIVGSVCDTLDGRYSRMSGKG